MNKKFLVLIAGLFFSSVYATHLTDDLFAVSDCEQSQALNEPGSLDYSGAENLDNPIVDAAAQDSLVFYRNVYSSSYCMAPDGYDDSREQQQGKYAVESDCEFLAREALGVEVACQTDDIDICMDIDLLEEKLANVESEVILATKDFEVLAFYIDMAKKELTKVEDDLLEKRKELAKSLRQKSALESKLLKKNRGKIKRLIFRVKNHK